MLVIHCAVLAAAEFWLSRAYILGPFEAASFMAASKSGGWVGQAAWEREFSHPFPPWLLLRLPPSPSPPISYETAIKTHASASEDK